jgi:hypothetical protein
MPRASNSSTNRKTSSNNIPIAIKGDSREVVLLRAISARSKFSSQSLSHTWVPCPERRSRGYIESRLKVIVRDFLYLLIILHHLIVKIKFKILK